MTGTIRTFQKCPVCNQAFKVTKLGFICTEHKTIPTRFVIDLSWNGKRIRIYSDKMGQVLDSYQRAVTLRSVITEEIQDHRFDPSKYMRSENQKFWVKNLLDEFLEQKKKEIAPSYIKNYEAMVNTGKEYFGSSDVRELRKRDIIEYKNHLDGLKRSQKTVKNYLDNFKTFLKWCQSDVEVISIVPAFCKVQIEERNFKWLDQENQSKIFEFVPVPDRPIIQFLMLHGCRPGEARALKVKDVNLKNQTITINATFSGHVYRERRKGRGSKPYITNIHPECLDYISDRVKSNLPEAWLFVNPRTGDFYSKSKFQRLWNTVRAIAKIGKELRLQDASRHSVASQLRNAGVDLSDVKEQLGHSQISTTMKYAHPDINKLKTNLGKLSLNKIINVCKASVEEKDAKIAIINQ